MPREARVVAWRDAGMRLSEIAARELVSIERVRQLEAKARRHLAAEEWTPESQFIELVTERS